MQRVQIASTLPEGQQAVKVRVKLPDGNPADWVDKVVEVPVAYNDFKGTWTVNATELYTGKTAMAKFTVE